MSERKPGIAPPTTDALKLRQNESLIKQVRRYKLITPLFGGGVDPGVNDEITPISGKAIRGHLRFWWRATRGGRFEDLDSLLKFESHMFGAATTEKDAKSSLIKLSVDVTNKGRKDSPYEVVSNRDGNPQTRLRKGTVIPPYAAFPLQPNSSEKEYKAGMKTKSVSIGAEFTLNISFPAEYAEDIKAALWAWETFGGIGARTRRGFGALQLESIDGVNVVKPDRLDSLEQVVASLDDQLKKYVGGGDWIEHLPHLSQNSVYEVTAFNKDALTCWRELIERLNQFRQQRNPPKIEKRGGREIKIPGRSKWNEPEAIRELTKQRLPKHQKIQPSFVKFPRAAFGLPLAFQFKDRDKHNPFNEHRDPRKTLLKLPNSERLASPLILRPITVSRTQFVGIALILDGTLLPDEMYLVLRNDEDRNKEEIAKNLKANLEKHEAQQIKSSDGKTPLLNNADVLYAFLDFLNLEGEE